MKLFIAFTIFMVHISLVDAQSCVKGNCTNGFGTMIMTDKSRYTGEFVNGKIQGRGIFYFANGSKYLGTWKSGTRHGEGKFIFNNGDQYVGAFVMDKIQGYGTMEYKNGDRYVGQWQNELPGGKGSYYLHSGERYEGEFLKGKFEGQGSYFYSDGSTYKGEWKNNKRHGYGEFFDGKNKTVSGQWQFDKAISVLAEDFAQKPESKEQPIKEKIKDKDLIPNCNKSFCKSGKGSLDYADGSKYIGEFVNGEPKGKGICQYANGDRYEGEWDAHAPHGEGVMYFKSGLIYGAIWNHGEATKQLHSKKEFVFDNKVKVDKDDAVKIWAVVVGIARYEHMPALKFADDDANRIFAFLKSPEGGALPDEQVRILIDEDATRNNILKAMNEVYMKADENDVIMLYYSGHGLEGTFIPIDYDGFENALGHDEVKDMFNKSKAKHKICYADACHSGSLLAAKSAFASSLIYFYDELDKSSGGTAFMMSSKSKEFSLEDGGLRQGIFSHFLIRGLKGEADLNKNKTITVKELFDWVYTKVREYTGLAQTPMIAGDYDEKMPVGFIREVN